MTAEITVYPRHSRGSDEITFRGIDGLELLGQRRRAAELVLLVVVLCEVESLQRDDQGMNFPLQ